MLYIVGTPIGNLEDLSPRAAKTLLSSDIILAEDTRTAQNLLDFCGRNYKSQIPNYKLVSYYKEREMEKLGEVLGYLNEGKKVSLISESGLPLISDPGYLLIKSVIRENIPFEVIPGPSAYTTAAVYSGFKTDNILFIGYFPKKSGAIVQSIKRLIEINKILADTIFIFYESPVRINNTLKLFNQYLSEANVCICRELTKKFEEIIRGKPADLLNLNKEYKGEITITISL